MSPAFDDLNALAERRTFFAALARRLVADAHLADDAVQDAAVAALRSGDRARGPLPAWFTGVVRHAAAAIRRGESRRAAREAANAVRALAPSTAELAEQLERQRLLARAVLDLGEPYRGTILLRYFEGLTPAAIAAREGVAPATVNSRLTRAHALLRDRLDRDFGGDRAAWVAGFLPLAEAVPVATAGLLSTGALLVKKYLAIAALVLAVAGGTWWWKQRAEPAPPSSAVAGAAEPRLGAGSPRPALGRPDREEPASRPADRRPARAVTAAPAARLAKIAVVVRDARTRAPAEGASLAVIPIDPAFATPEQQRALRELRESPLGTSEDYLRIFAAPALTDAAGEATIDGPAHCPAQVVAWRGDFGAVPALAEAGATEPIELALEALPAATVRVVDAGGRPCADIPVALRAILGPFSATLVRGVTAGETGEARIRDHLWITRQAEQVELELALDFPGAGATSAAFPRAHWPEDVVTLVCPPLGRVRATLVDAAGAAFTAATLVSVRAAGAPSEPPGASETLTGFQPGGTVELGPVAAGVPLLVSAGLGPDQVQEITETPGPAAAGGIAEVTIQLDGRLVELCGRLVDDSGRPLLHARAQLELARERPCGDAVRSLATDGEGNFRTQYADTRKHPLAGAASLCLLDGPDGASSGPALSLAIPQGADSVDFGDIVVGAARPLLSGVVLDPEGRPAPGIELRLEVREAPDRPFATFALAPPTDGAGRFAFAGDALPAGAVRVTALARGALRLAPTPIAEAQGEITLVLESSAAIAGRLLAPEGVPLERLHVSVAPTSAADAPLLTPAWTPATVVRDGTFTAGGLELGTYTVAIGVGGSMRPLLRVDGVSASAADSARDPRLDPLDLKAALGAVDLDVVDEGGRRVPDARIYALRQGTGFDELGRATGPVPLAREPAITALLVVAKGYCPQSLALPQGRHRVVLARGVECHMALPPAIAAPAAPYSIQVTLIGAGDAEVAGGARAADYLARFGPQRAAVAADGTCALRVPAAGLYRAAVALRWYQDGVENVRPVADAQRLWIAEDAASSVHVLELDAAAIERERAEIERWRAALDLPGDG